MALSPELPLPYLHSNFKSQRVTHTNYPLLLCLSGNGICDSTAVFLSSRPANFHTPEPGHERLDN